MLTQDLLSSLGAGAEAYCEPPTPVGCWVVSWATLRVAHRWVTTGSRPGRADPIQPTRAGFRLSMPCRSPVVLDSPRLLARNSTHEHPMLGTGYTDDESRALREEPEAVRAE